MGALAGRSDLQGAGIRIGLGMLRFSWGCADIVDILSLDALQWSRALNLTSEMRSQVRQ